MTRAIVCIALLGGCASARVVEHDDKSGVIELSGNRTHAMEDATDKMARLCQVNNYTIRKEGFESVDGKQVWRVHFACNVPTMTPIAPAEPAQAEPPAVETPPAVPMMIDAGVKPPDADAGSAGSAGSGSGSSGSGQ